MVGEEGRSCVKMMHALFLVISTYSRHIMLVRVLHMCFRSPGGMRVGPEPKSQLRKSDDCAAHLVWYYSSPPFHLPGKSLPGST